MVVQHLHTVRCESSTLSITTNYLSKVLPGCIRGLGPCGLGSNPSRETKFCKCQQVETRSKYSSKVLRRKRQMGSTPTLRGTAGVCKGDYAGENPSDIHRARGQARRPVSPE